MSSIRPCSSSAGRRLVATIDGSTSNTLTCNACGPRRPSATPYSTFCPGLRVATPVGSAVDRTCTSSPPPSWAMKPKPFSASYHLILPLGTQLTCPDQWAGNVPPENGRRCCGIDARRSTSLPAAFACSVPSTTSLPDGCAAPFGEGPGALSWAGGRPVGTRYHPARPPS